MTFLKDFFSKRLVLHPFLLCLFYTLQTANLIEGKIDFYDLQKAFFILFCSVSVVFLGFYWLSKDFVKTGVLLTLWLIFLGFSMPFIRDVWEKIPFLSKIGGYNFKIIVLCCLTIVVSYGLFRKKEYLPNINLFLNLLFVIYTLIEAFTLYRLSGQQPKVACQNCPDIYFILPDSYAATSSLHKYWQYDNTDFEKKLADKGFFIVPTALSSYDQTRRTIASMLNMRFLDTRLSPDYGDTPEQFNTIKAQIKYNAVFQKLYLSGYQIYNLSVFDILEHSAVPNQVFFEHDYLKVLFWRTVPDFIVKNSFGYNMHHYVADKVKKIASQPTKAPKMVYAHLMLPHSPYIFDRNGNSANTQLTPKERYLEQLIYTNQVIDGIVNSILSNTNRKAIILISGDHGSHELPDPERIAQLNHTFSAFYFPDQNYQSLTDTMATVNYFKAIFNYAFNTKQIYAADSLNYYRE
jgi:hypothetical protein